jgi:hypothetical protein
MGLIWLKCNIRMCEIPQWKPFEQLLTLKKSSGVGTSGRGSVKREWKRVAIVDVLCIHEWK